MHRRAGAAVVLALVVSGCGASSAGPGATGAPSESASAPAPSPSATSVPAPPTGDGWQHVSSLGVEVDAPVAWPINSWEGCGPAPDALVRRGQGAGRGCGNDGVVPNLLEILRSASTGGQPGSASPGPEPAVVSHRSLGDASAVVTTTTSAGGQRDVRVDIASLGVTVHATSPDPVVLDRMVDSVRVLATVDSLGCPVSWRPASWDRRRPGPAVPVPSEANVTVCAYQADIAASGAGTTPPPRPVSESTVLAASTSLTAEQGRTALAALADAGPGPAPDAPEDQCLRDALPDLNPVLVRMTSVDGALTELRVHYSGCVDRWVAGVDGESQVSQAILAALLNPLHRGYGLSEPLPEK